jgi:sugar phosphate isomerase/epimerase
MSYPKLSISECTTYTASIDEDLDAYQAAGVEGIGIWEYKLPHGRDEQLRTLIEESGLKPTLCVPEVPSIIPDPFFTEPKDPKERRDALCAAIKRFAKFDPVAVMVLSGSPEGRDKKSMRKTVVEGVRVAAEVAGELGITLGFEPLRQSAGSLTTTMPDTLELLDEIGAPNIQVIADTWHFWDVPNALDHLTKHADRIIGVQINDWREPPRSWCDRVLPGDGQIDFPSIYAALEKGGYDGWYDVEVFSDSGLFGADYPDSLWKVPADELARRAVRSFRATWDARRQPAHR